MMMMMTFKAAYGLHAAFLNPEDLDRGWMEAPQQPKAKISKQPQQAQHAQHAQQAQHAQHAQQAQHTQQQHQQQPKQLQKQSSLEKESSQEGFVDHAGDSLDDAAAAGELQFCIQATERATAFASNLNLHWWSPALAVSITWHQMHMLSSISTQTWLPVCACLESTVMMLMVHLAGCACL